MKRSQCAFASWFLLVMGCLLVLALTSGCSFSFARKLPRPTQSLAGGRTYRVKVSWNPNREAAVNRSGGGYRVSYGTDPGSSTAGASVVDVPYVSGSAAPVTTMLSGLEAGTYYIRVSAYSAVPPVEGGPQSVSAASEPVAVTVP